MNLSTKQDGVRLDVIYKTIVRDMRKFFVKDFNL